MGFVGLLVLNKVKESPCVSYLMRSRLLKMGSLIPWKRFKNPLKGCQPQQETPLLCQWVLRRGMPNILPCLPLPLNPRVRQCELGFPGFFEWWRGRHDWTWGLPLQVKRWDGCVTLWRTSSAVIICPLDLPGSKSVHENRVHCTFEWPVDWLFLGDVEPNYTPPPSLSLSLSLEAWNGSRLPRSFQSKSKHRRKDPQA